METITQEELSAAAGILLSLGFSYLPGIKDRFENLSPTYKRLVMLGLLALTALTVFALGCAQAEWAGWVSCSEQGAWALARIFIAALIANQAAFGVAPRLNSSSRSSMNGC